MKNFPLPFIRTISNWWKKKIGNAKLPPFSGMLANDVENKIFHFHLLEQKNFKKIQKRSIVTAQSLERSFIGITGFANF